MESSTHRITGDVDHHRPKGQIKHYPPDRTIPDLPGYWWLAFCWRNFRYSCEICNRPNTDSATGIVGGKGNYFPLVDPTRRICDECDYDDLLIEDPLLLILPSLTIPLCLPLILMVQHDLHVRSKNIQWSTCELKSLSPSIIEIIPI